MTVEQPEGGRDELADLRAEVERANRVIAEYERKVWRRDQRLLELEGVARTNAAWGQQQHAAAKEARGQRDALQCQVDAVVSVCSNTDGDLLDGESEIPVGEVLRMLVENGATISALDAVEPADQPHPQTHHGRLADRCGVVWHVSPSVSWSCGLLTGHEGAHLNPDFPEQLQGPEDLRAGL